MYVMRALEKLILCFTVCVALLYFKWSNLLNLINERKMKLSLFFFAETKPSKIRLRFTSLYKLNAASWF